MAPFVPPLDGYHAATKPRDWLESLVKAYVGDGVADDFYREVAAGLAEPDRALILGVLHDDRHAAFAVTEVRAATGDDPLLAGRLALWGRRLAAEAVSLARATALANPALALLPLTLDGGFEGLLTRLTVAHAARMTRIGLHG
jgi:hypothetical protein